MKTDHMNTDASAQQILTRGQERINFIYCRLPNMAAFVLPLPTTAAVATANDATSCHQFVLAAGRELTAFVAAVDESFGRDRARSAEAYWLKLFEDMDLLPGGDGVSFRQVTFQAAARLATEVMGSESCRT